MPYEVIAPAVSVLYKIGEVRTDEGKLIGHEHKSVLHGQGDVVTDEDISPVVVQMYNDGDAHVRSVLKKVAKARAAKAEEKAEEE